MNISKENMQNEIDYRIAIIQLKFLLEKGLIDSDDYIMIESIYREKYKPFLSLL